jgi:hypothetical protein
VGVGASGGSLVGGVSAFNAEMNNRMLHETELMIIRLSANGDAKREGRLLAAACALVKCYAEYPVGSSEYVEYRKLAAFGESNECKIERAILSAYPDEFKYSRREDAGYLSDEFKDKLRRKDNTYQISTRVGGGVQVVGGVAGVATAVITAPAACATVVLCFVNGTAATLSADQARSGLITVWTGRDTPTLLNDAIRAMGASEEVAGYLETAVNLGLGAKLAKVPMPTKLPAINPDEWRKSSVSGGSQKAAAAQVIDEKPAFVLLEGDGRFGKVGSPPVGNAGNPTLGATASGDAEPLLLGYTPTTHTLAQIRRMSQPQAWQAGEQYIQELTGSAGQAHFSVPSGPFGDSIIFGSGGRFVDAPVIAADGSIIANEVKTYKQWTTVKGSPVQKTVPLSPQIEQQVLKDSWLQTNVRGYNPRWIFLDAPPSPELANYLKKHSINYIIHH